VGARRGKWGLRIKERPRGSFFCRGAKEGAGREGKRMQGARTTRPSRVGKAIFAVTLPALLGEFTARDDFSSAAAAAGGSKVGALGHSYRFALSPPPFSTACPLHFFIARGVAGSTAPRRDTPRAPRAARRRRRRCSAIRVRLDHGAPPPLLEPGALDKCDRAGEPCTAQRVQSAQHETRA
jgi:hypothetical protein